MINLSIFQSILFREMAYLDPGTGSFLIQLLIGAVVGAALLIKTYWNKIKGLFYKNDAAETSAEEAAKVDAPKNPVANEK